MVRQTFLAAAIVAVVIGQAGKVRAGTINLATGLNGSGSLIDPVNGGGQLDANWTVEQVTGSAGSFVLNGVQAAAQVVVQSSADWYGGWVANGPNSNWIARNVAITDNGPIGTTYNLNFNLTGYNLSTVSIAGAWTIDDDGTLSLNGHLLSTLSDGSWTQLNTFSVATGSSFFNPGLNTLTMTEGATDDFLEGARLEGTLTGVSAVTPEPGSLALSLIATFGLLGYGWRRWMLAPVAMAC
jgi:hypothetical protein